MSLKKGQQRQIMDSPNNGKGSVQHSMSSDLKSTKPENSKFLQELEKENEILQSELQRLLDIHETKDKSTINSLDLVRFSFNDITPLHNATYGSQEEDSQQPFQLHKLSQKQEEPDDELEQCDSLEQPYPFQLQPQKTEDFSCRSYNSTQLSTTQSAALNQLDSLRKSASKEKQIKSLEMRLSGTREALKSVEKELKDKNKVIIQLQQEQQKKTFLKDIQQKENQDVSNRQQISDSIIELKKKEKILEKRLQESEITNKENKKYMLRLQELNSSLLIKVKSYEEERLKTEKNSQPQSQSQEVKDLQTRLQVVMQEKKELQKKFDCLKHSSDDYLSKTADLKDKYNYLVEKLQEVIQ